jgi:hypothetical protein
MKNKSRRESGTEEEQEVDIHAARPMTVRVPLVPNPPPIPRTPDRQRRFELETPGTENNDRVEASAANRP